MTENNHETTALTTIEPREVAPRLPFEQDIELLGRAMVASGFFKDTKSASQAMVRILAGREIGLPPIASMTGVHIIDGKISLGANLIAAAVKRSGRYNYRVREHSPTVCRIEFFEQGESVGVSEFTMADAQAAGINSKPVWRQYPRNLLFARALTNGARWYCADVFGGAVYTPEELDHDEARPFVVQSVQEDDQTAAPDPAPVVQTYPNVEPGTVTMAEDDDEPASVHTTDTLDAFGRDLKAELDRRQASAVTIRFARNAPGMQEFIKLVELERPVGLGLDANGRKDALGGKSVNGYMVQQGWQDEPRALDFVWAVLETMVLATEAAEVGATE